VCRTFEMTHVYIAPGLPNLRHAEKYPWRAAFPDVLSVIIFNLFALQASLYGEECIHTSDCVERLYELQLLPNNTATEIFLHKLGAVGSVDWIFITRAPAYFMLLLCRQHFETIWSLL